ncbi:MAG: PAS domain S-box protein [Betaproteobacteria bacterium]
MTAALPGGTAPMALSATEFAMLVPLLEHIPGRVIAIDRDHRYLYVNQEFLDFWNVRLDQAIGHPIADLLGDEIFRSFLPVARRLWAGESIRHEGWVDYPGHGERYMQEYLVPYAPDGGPIRAIFAFGRDFTELKLRERELASHVRELQQSEALKSAIVDYALAALISTDEEGRIVEFNPSAELMFQRRREDVVGRRVSQVVIPERFRAMHDAGMARIKAGGASRILGKRMQLHGLRADGTEFPIEMVLWRTDVGGAGFYTASMVDVTVAHDAAREIERQREALRQSERLTAMGSLLAGVALELNNPLAIVMGRASLLEEKCVDQPDLRLDAQRIREAADRCGRIVRTFLDMARSEPAQRTSVAINELVLAAVDLLQYGYRSHGIELDLRLAQSLPVVMGDGGQIGQIVLNLLVNAQQALAACSPARRVVVQTGVEHRRTNREPRVWLRVADNGPGVPLAERDNIFEPFFTTKPAGVGTGLGLAVSRSLARAHGGELLLEVGEPQGGATFRLSLPVSGVAPAASDTAPLPRSAPSQQARVLVVDDEPELADVMREMLEDAGYEVASAESGAVALALLESARFDAIVSDLRMPDMDGAALWREVCARHPTLAEAIVFVTGDTLSLDARDFLRRTRCATLDKPFSKAALLAQVARLLAPGDGGATPG